MDGIRFRNEPGTLYWPLYDHHHPVFGGTVGAAGTSTEVPPEFPKGLPARAFT